MSTAQFTPIPREHAVQRLFEQRVANSTRPYRSRGFKVKRCHYCRIGEEYCICGDRPAMNSRAGFVLLMYDTEVMKPSNTGRLIADLVKDTQAFLWSRTEHDPKLLALLADPKWQPYVVFPADKAEGREVYEHIPPAHRSTGKRPLFIMLDGNWREARKMFMRSPYLQDLPVLSLPLDENSGGSRYLIRKAAKAEHLATAEVAARLLALAGEEDNAELLDLWFDLFNYRYRMAVLQTNTGRKDALERMQAFLKERDAVRDA